MMAESKSTRLGLGIANAVSLSASVTEPTIKSLNPHYSVPHYDT
jgi:hypothetical protein